MKAIICDNNKCKKIIIPGEERCLSYVSDGIEYNIELCDECFNTALDLLNKALNLHTDNNDTDKNVKNEITESSESDCEALAKFFDTNTEDEELHDYKLLKPRIKRGSVSILIEKYGTDRLINEYTKKNVSMQQLANDIGIKTSSLAGYLRQHNIRKNKKRETSSPEQIEESYHT